MIDLHGMEVNNGNESIGMLCMVFATFWAPDLESV